MPKLANGREVVVFHEDEFPTTLRIERCGHEYLQFTIEYEYSEDRRRATTYLNRQQQQELLELLQGELA